MLAKTKGMVFSFFPSLRHNLYLNSTEIDKVKSITYLGFILEYNKKFDGYIFHFWKEISRKHAILCALRSQVLFQGLDQSILFSFISFYELELIGLLGLNRRALNPIIAEPNNTLKIINSNHFANTVKL